ncbi:MAG: hypothetical protein ACRCZU_09180 [Selenomonadaceae bacterium]
MEMIFIILAFLAVAVLSDRMDGRKGKRHTLPPKDGGGPEIKIPPIKGAPLQKKPGVYQEPARAIPKETVAETNKYQQFLANKRTRQKMEQADYEKSQAKLQAGNTPPKKGTNIHTNAILNAVAYEQILGRPRAWKLLKGRWRSLDER